MRVALKVPNLPFHGDHLITLAALAFKFVSFLLAGRRHHAHKRFTILHVDYDMHAGNMRRGRVEKVNEDD